MASAGDHLRNDESAQRRRTQGASESQATSTTTARPSGPFVKPFDVSPAGTQLGDIDIETEAGIQIRGLKLMVGPAGTRWVGSPGNWRKGADGEFVLDNKDKRIFDPTVDFKDRATCEKFCDLVLEALRHVRPELFQRWPIRHSGSWGRC